MVWSGSSSVFCGATVIRWKFQIGTSRVEKYFLCLYFFTPGNCWKIITIAIAAFKIVKPPTIIIIFSDEWILTASHCVDGTNAAEIQVPET